MLSKITDFFRGKSAPEQKALDIKQQLAAAKNPAYRPLLQNGVSRRGLSKKIVPKKLSYHLIVNPKEKYTAGYCTNPNQGTVPAPAGFDPEKHSARIESNGELTLVPLAEYEAHEEKRRQADFERMRATQKAAAKSKKSVS